ncbi:Belongs to the UDP-glycosyltransferase [Dionaea muscipula]
MAAESRSSCSTFHIVMFPWFAIGHMTPFLHLSNKLAEKGHRISFLLPNKAKLQLQHLNLHPNLISLHSLTIPNDVQGLPPGAETASDVSIHQISPLATALDLTRPLVERMIRQARPRPDFVFYDTAHWIPEITSSLGIKSICYNVVCAASLAIALVPARNNNVTGDIITEEELATPPPGYPSGNVILRKHEARNLLFISKEFGHGITFYERTNTAMRCCDAIAIRTCRELEGDFVDYLGAQFEKPVFLTGPVLPKEEEEEARLADRWAEWLGRFQPGSVVFCAFGSQFVLDKDQFQEILMGFESTGLPFLLALKPPIGFTAVEEAFPQGFKERVEGRGVVDGGWVQQPLILSHPSVGCFVNHCGFGSMWEGLKSEAQMVLVPQLGDQILNTRLMAGELKVAVEVEREENGWVSKVSLCKAIKAVMDQGSEIGCLVKKNHAKWREILVHQGFLNGYIDAFIKDLRGLLAS